MSLRALDNIGGTSGDLSKVIKQLIDQFGPDEAAKIARSSQFANILKYSSPAPAAAAVAPAVGIGVGGLLGAQLLGEGISGGIGAALTALKPEPTPPMAAGTPSKFFFQPETQANYTQWYQKEVYNVRRWNSTVGKLTGQLLQEPPSPEEFARASIERSENQGESFNQRLIEQQRAKDEAAYATEAMQAGFGLEEEKVKTLGDIQRQRISSGYTTAGSALNSAIQNILATSKLENSPVLAEVARAF
jgi:hypothetical protein